MNEQRRAIIENILERLNDILNELEALRDEENAEYKNLPKAWKQGEQGEKMEDVLENLEDALGSLDEVVCYLEDAIAEEE